MTKAKPLTEFLERALGNRSKSELARVLGVSKSTVGRWVSGERVPPERFRASLRAAARPGWTVPPPPPRLTAAGVPARTTGQAIITPLPGGGANIHTHARATFARELRRLSGTGNVPSRFSVELHGFRAADSPTDAPKRTRVVTVQGLSPAEIAALASGSKAALEAAITRGVGARNYFGEFEFDRAVDFSFDTPF
ncbi:helix-turn-helix domain-containing protein [Nocardia brasiliensis]|uniref:helix-turn-helix domain-containing protein n=1 Tax=Nocardia brasiliensis TaxID=37326 RepID=UPI0024549C59|nr:helix-turn-helix transcriptional regulator [Nocardia brasiliensis]